MQQAHLTSVGHISRNKWQASCDCGWHDDDNATKRDAIGAAEKHWAASPLVTDVKMGER